MATEAEKNWIDAVRIESDYRTMNEFTGDGVTGTYEINFIGGYLNLRHVKGESLDTVNGIRTDLTLDFIGPNTVRVSPVPGVGHVVTIYRDTPKDLPLISFTDGAMITAPNLDRNAKQAVFGVAEMLDRFSIAYKQVELAEMYANAARDSADRAETDARFINSVYERFKLTDELIAQIEAARDASADSEKAAREAHFGSVLARDRAEAARDSAEALVDWKYTFTSIELGMAGTAEGEFFRVPNGPGAEYSFSYYHHVGEDAILVAQYIGKTYVDKQLIRGPYRASFIPLHQDKLGRVPLWLDHSRLEVAGFGNRAQKFIAEVPNEYAMNYVRVNTSAGNKIPLFYDKNEKVPIWLDKSAFDVAAFGPRAQGLIKEIAGTVDPGPGPVPDPEPSVTRLNDESYLVGDLHQVVRKCAGIQYKDAVSLNIAFTGDSWTERSMIPQGLLDIINGGSTKDPGWISCSTRGDGRMAGIVCTMSGYSTYDGGANRVSLPPYGCGPDGNAYYTRSGQSGTVTWSGVKATTLDLYYYDGDGVMVVDAGGQNIVITGSNSKSIAKRTITGLSGTTPYSVRIVSQDLGVTSLFGMYGRNADERTGVTVSRMGNGGAIASDFYNWQAYVEPIVKDFDLDLICILLGTNDARLSKGVEQYEDGIRSMIATYRRANPRINICLISPAQCNEIGNPGHSAYDAVMRKLAIEYNISFVSGYTMMPKTYSNAQGEWVDGLHLSKYGAYQLVSKLRQFILGALH